MSGSLSIAKGFTTADVFQLSLAPVFTPEQIELGEYSFLPWVRTGLAAQLTDAKAGELRASVATSVSVEDDAGGKSLVSKTFLLRGPGDVVGIDPTQIVRRYPQPNSANAEETYLAHIEFDRPELPWLFTPFHPVGDRLAPWMALVVVEERFFSLKQGSTGLPWQVTTKLGELQPLDDSWAWAHAQISGMPAGAVTVEDRLGDSYGPVNLSRLLCPRKLDPNVSYVACVVPAFDCGVKAGMGLPGGTLAPAWTRSAGDNNSDITLPVYDSWRFQIAPAGDFESLAKKLKGLPAPWPIGRRIIDFAKPRGGMTDLAAGENGRVQVFKCALTSLQPAPGGIETSAWTTAKRQELLSQVNNGDQAASDISKASDLPRVSPRLYARYQRAESRLSGVTDADWFSQLNTTPTHRVAAGLGTRVIQKDQETLMQAAWSQVGEIDKVNQRLALAQFARYAAEAVHKSNLSPLPLGALAQVTRAVQGKLRLGGDALTVSGNALRSATAPAALTGAFRRATRLRGPVTRFLGANGAKAMNSMVASANDFQNYQRPYQEPDGIGGLSANAMAYFNVAAIAKVMNVAPAGALAALKDAVTKNATKPTITDQIFQAPGTWRTGTGTIDLGAIAASNLLDVVDAASPAKASDAPSRSEALASLLTGISTSGITEAATRAQTIATRVGVQIGRVSTTTTTPTTSPTTTPTTSPRISPSVLVTPATSVTVRGPLAGLTTTPAVTAGPATRITPTTTTPAASTVLTSPAALSAAALNVSAVVKKTGAISLQIAATSLSDFATGLGVPALAADPTLPQLAVQQNALLAAIHPKTTVTAYMVARLGTLPSWLAKDWFNDGYVQPIMQAPVFTRPMYEALDSYDREWLIPGLGQIQDPDIVTILQTNPAFIETFLTGLSDEMGRELLWRGYPTDSRGTYFKRFWNADQDELGQQIHLFSHTPLGTHISAAAGGASGRLVLLVRGELIRRYPHAIMMAQQQTGKDASGHPLFAVPPAPGAPGSIMFHVPLAPDIFLTGFLLTEQDVKNADAGGNPWWFIIGEHPTAPRFGLDLPPSPPPPPIATVGRDNVTWASFGSLRLGRFLPTGGASVKVTEPLPSAESTQWAAAQLHGGAVARVLLQDPSRAAWNGLKLITPAK